MIFCRRDPHKSSFQLLFEKGNVKVYLAVLLTRLEGFNELINILLTHAFLKTMKNLSW